MQVNILQAGKIDPVEAQQSLLAGYGGAIGAAALAASMNHGARGIVGAGLAGGLVEMAGNALVKDVTYSLITDVQLGERSANVVTTTSTQNLQQGSSGGITQNSQTISNFTYSRTRVLSTADQVNLEFAEALPTLQSQLEHSLAGLF